MNYNIKYYSNGNLQKLMINNHIKSWHTEKANYRDGIPPMHGFFMATRRQTCPERLERRIVTNTENNIKETI